MNDPQHPKRTFESADFTYLPVLRSELPAPLQYSRIPLILFLVLFLLWTVDSRLSTAAQPQPQPDVTSRCPPNIILILCDDLGYSDLGCYGGEIRTPNLDRLAAEGLRFTQFYNNAVCVTTRASVVTGLYPRRGKGGLLRSNMVTLGEVLRQAGYRTALTGKWHLGSEPPRRPVDRGFNEYYGVLSGCCNFFDPGRSDPVFYNGGKHRPFAHNEKPLTEFPADYYTTDAFTDHAVDFIKSQTAKQKNREPRTANREQNERSPFFLHLCYTAPHFPLHARPEDVARYRGAYDDGYFALRPERHRRQVEIGIVDPDWDLSPVDHKLGPFRYDYEVTPWEDVADLAREKRRMEVYAAMVDRMDQGIGRVLRALEEAGIEKETLVLFLSDNGGCASWPREDKIEAFLDYNREMPGGVDTYDFVGPGWGWAQNTPFRRHKVWTYEGGIATPMIARWRGVIAPDTITREVGHVIDFMPTFVELAGTKYPETFNGKTILPVEGRSLVPLLLGKKREDHPWIAWELYGNRAIRSAQWKLVWGASAGKWELFDMKADRTETRDLAKARPELVKQLSATWREWAERTEVPQKTSL